MLSYRTAVHPADEVTGLRSADDGATRVQWALQLRCLSDLEMDAVQTLFRATRGAHGEFVFLDPEGNLLSNSESLLASVWGKSAGLEVTPAATAPASAEAAFAIAAPVSQTGEFWQSALLPTNYYWLLSAYARALTAVPFTLFIRSAHGEKQMTAPLSPTWKRFSFGGLWWPAGEGIDIGFRIPANRQAEVSALQLESQTAPSSYKRTTAVTGVFSNARFLDDSLRVTSLAPNCHQINLRIGAPIAGYIS